MVTMRQWPAQPTLIGAGRRCRLCAKRYNDRRKRKTCTEDVWILNDLLRDIGHTPFQGSPPMHVDAHHVNVGDLKQLGAAAATRSAAGVDQRADIGFARGDDAVERHGDVFEVGHGAQTVDFALVRGDFGVRGT